MKGNGIKAKTPVEKPDVIKVLSAEQLEQVREYFRWEFRETELRGALDSLIDLKRGSGEEQDASMIEDAQEIIVETLLPETEEWEENIYNYCANRQISFLDEIDARLKGWIL